MIRNKWSYRYRHILLLHTATKRARQEFGQSLFVCAHVFCAYVSILRQRYTHIPHNIHCTHPTSHAYAITPLPHSNTGRFCWGKNDTENGAVSSVNALSLASASAIFISITAAWSDALQRFAANSRHAPMPPTALHLSRGEGSCEHTCGRHIYIHVYMCVYIYAYMYTHITYPYVYTYLNMCMYTYVNICIYDIYLCKSMYIYTCTYMCVYVCIYKYIHIYVCIYLCIHIHIAYLWITKRLRFRCLAPFLCCFAAPRADALLPPAHPAMSIKGVCLSMRLCCIYIYMCTNIYMYIHIIISSLKLILQGPCGCVSAYACVCAIIDVQNHIHSTHTSN